MTIKNKMFLTSISNNLVLHDSKSWTFKQSHGSYDETIRDISWSDDGKYLLQVNPKGQIEILNATEVEIRSLQHVSCRSTCAATFQREGHRFVAVGCKIGQVHLWDTKHKTICKTFLAPPVHSPVTFLSYNSKNNNLAASLQNGETVIYGTTSNCSVLNIKVPNSKSVSAMKFHHEIRALLGLATDEGHILLKDIMSNKNVMDFKSVHSSPVSDFAYSAINRDIVFSCGYDRVMHIYDMRKSSVVSTVATGHTLSSIAVNEDNIVALGTRKGNIIIYDLRDFTSPICVLTDHKSDVRRICYQPLYKRKVSSQEISLKETSQVTAMAHVISPVVSGSPEVFDVSETSPVNEQSQSRSNMEGQHEKEDSFFLKMGLDENSTADDMVDIIRKSDIFANSNKVDTPDYRISSQNHVERSIGKSSTPLTSKIPNVLISPSPLRNDTTASPDTRYSKSVENQRALKHVTTSRGNLTGSETIHNVHDGSTGTVETKIDELKNIVLDLAEDSNNRFLNLLLTLTKQKLFLEDKITCLGNEVKNMQKTQDVLLKENNRLLIELELLKATCISNNNNT